MRRLAAALTTVVAVATLAACSDTAPRSIDAAIDTASACGCTADQICVASYDGTCRKLGPTCVTRTVDCPNNTCSTACETAYCGAPLQCQNRAPCGGEPAGAFTCYGP
jgi:hypothetical protein